MLLRIGSTSISPATRRIIGALTNGEGCVCGVVAVPCCAPTLATAAIIAAPHAASANVRLDPDCLGIMIVLQRDASLLLRARRRSRRRGRRRKLGTEPAHRARDLGADLRIHVRRTGRDDI